MSFENGIAVDVGGGLSAVQQPLQTARGLANKFYTSDDTFEIERKAVLFDNWSALCFGNDIPNAGDAMPIDFVGAPLLAVRDRDLNVRVYENVCRHRGMTLVAEKKNISGAIRCPYHSWCYGLDGRLITTPHVGGAGYNTHPGICREDLGLIEVPSHVWRDVVFVNVSANAQPFEVCNEHIINRWQEYDQPFYFGGKEGSFTLSVNANWKLAVENFCEAYHLPWIHPGLNSFSKLEDHYHIEQPGAYSGQGSTKYVPAISPTGERFASFANLGEKWDLGAEYISLFPNVLLGTHRDHCYAMILMPQGRNHTQERFNVYYANEEMVSDEWAEMRATNLDVLRTIFVEDVGVVEGMQKGRQSPHFDGGRFSPAMDGPTHVFHAWVAANFVRDGRVTQ